MKYKILFLGIICVLFLGLGAVIPGRGVYHLSSSSNSQAIAGAAWIEGMGLHWADGGYEYDLQGKCIGEAGRESGLNDDSWHKVTLNPDCYSTTPIVLATTQTVNDGQDPSAEHINNVTQSSFWVQHCEYQSPDGCDSHASETVGWFAFDPNKVNNLSGMDAGTVQVSDYYEENVSYTESLYYYNATFTQTQTKNGGESALSTNAMARSSDKFTLVFCEQDGTDTCDSGHTTETVGWLAIDFLTANKFLEDGNGGVFDWGVELSESSDRWTTRNILTPGVYKDSNAVVIADSFVYYIYHPDEHAIYEQVKYDGGGVPFESGACESDGGDSCDPPYEVGKWLAIRGGSVYAAPQDPYTSAPNGAWWIDGDRINFVGSGGTEWGIKGDIFDSSPPGPNGAAWLQNSVLHYIDSDGEERNFCTDADGDGYKAEYCGGEDCCDSDSDVHPGQTTYYGSSNACGDFDYNCDGTEEKKYTGSTDDCGDTCSSDAFCHIGWCQSDCSTIPPACGNSCNRGTGWCIMDTCASLKPDTQACR